jgi:hypothetical protein
MSAGKRKRKAAGARKAKHWLAALEKHAQRKLARAKLQGHLSALAQGAPLNWKKDSADLFGLALTLLVPPQRLDEIAEHGITDSSPSSMGDDFGAADLDAVARPPFHGKRVT